MTSGMTSYEKIAVSLPTRAAESARRAVRRGRAPSVSAYVAAAIEEKAKNDDLSAFLDEMLAETGGPLTAAEKRAADRALGLPKSRKRVPKDYTKYTYSLQSDGGIKRKERRGERGKRKVTRKRRG